MYLPFECGDVIACRYPLFDFVIRNHKDSSRLPLHHLQRVAREIHPTFRADFITRLASAARSRMENTTSSSFGTVQMSRVTYVPLGHFKAFAPMRDTELPWSRHLYDRNELLLGPPKSASRRQFLVSFIGNEYPTVCVMRTARRVFVSSSSLHARLTVELVLLLCVKDCE